MLEVDGQFVNDYIPLLIDVIIIGVFVCNVRIER